MPLIQSAIKRMRQAAKRRARNVGAKRHLKTALKAFTTKAGMKSLQKAQSELDKAVKKNILNKNTASRKKAQLAAAAKVAGVKVAAKKTPSKPASKTTAVKKAPAKKPAGKKTA